MNLSTAIPTRLVQMEVLSGRPVENTARMLDHIRAARTKGIRLVVFPEMSIPGYLIGDEWERLSFIRECEACTHEIREASDGMLVVFGSVGVDWMRRNEDGRVRKYNALFVAENRRFLRPYAGLYDFVIKTLLPNYREFDDSRHFYDIRKLALEEQVPVESLITPVHTQAFRLGAVLCEDAWDTDYAISPLRVLADKGVDLFVNISCSPFTLNKNHKRNRIFSAHAASLGAPLIYVNNVGIQDNGKTVYTFDGSSCVYDSHGHQLRCGNAFHEATQDIDLSLGPAARFDEPICLQPDTIADLCSALQYGTEKFMAAVNAQTVTVGISGGIDSAVVAALYRTFLSPEQMLLVNMPSRYNSTMTIRLAQTLAKQLGCFYTEIPIEDSVTQTIAQIDALNISSLDGHLHGTLRLTEAMRENVQARDRSSRILAAASCAFGGVFTCNANKSEATVGYTTLYGDLGGYLANVADVWKTEIYALGRHLNETIFGREVIPQGIFDITPSAELSSAQNVDEGRGDPLIYPYHDLLFRSWVEWWNRATPEEILSYYADGTLESKLGYEGKIDAIFPTAARFIADLERWWNQYQRLGIAKRIQSPPVLAVKKRAFGFDHRESQTGPRYTRPYDRLKARLLSSHS